MGTGTLPPEQLSIYPDDIVTLKVKSTSECFALQDNLLCHCRIQHPMMLDGFAALTRMMKHSK